MIKMLFTSLGRFVLGKIVPSVLRSTLGPRLQAVLKTSGILFPIRTSRPANNVTYMYNMCDFLTQNYNSRLIVPQFKYSMHRLIQKFRVTGKTKYLNRLSHD